MSPEPDFCRTTTLDCPARIITTLKPSLLIEKLNGYINGKQYRLEPNSTPFVLTFTAQGRVSAPGFEEADATATVKLTVQKFSEYVLCIDFQRVEGAHSLFYQIHSEIQKWHQDEVSEKMDAT